MFIHLLGKPIVGIYSIYCIDNNKIYIGQSRHIRKRLCKHIRDLRKCRHQNEYLQRAWNKHGEQSFLFDVVETLPLKNLTDRENFFIL